MSGFDHTPPALPDNVSSDGREIWDWAAKFASHVHRMDEIDRLKREVGAIGRSCGDCDRWMKSRDCPQERNERGRRSGPSMNAPRCGRFLEDRSAAKRRAELTAKLAVLEQVPSTPTTGPHP